MGWLDLVDIHLNSYSGPSVQLVNNIMHSQLQYETKHTACSTVYVSVCTNSMRLKSVQPIPTVLLILVKSFLVTWSLSFCTWINHAGVLHLRLEVVTICKKNCRWYFSCYVQSCNKCKLYLNSSPYPRRGPDLQFTTTHPRTLPSWNYV